MRRTLMARCGERVDVAGLRPRDEPLLGARAGFAGSGVRQIAQLLRKRL